MNFRIISILLLISAFTFSIYGCSNSEATQTSNSSVREIVDMGGRTVIVPNEIGKIFTTDPVASIYIYTFDPNRLLGWNFELNAIERSMVLEEYHSIPIFGMGASINYEAVIAAQPTIALVVSRINDGSIDRADAFTESLGIPTILLSSDLEDTPEVYRFLGELLGMEERAEKLALYVERTFYDIASMIIPRQSIARIYYGNSEDSLQTSPAGALDARVIEMINAVNVADLELGEGSRIRISPEQLLAWDPDVMVVNGEPRANLSGAAAAQLILNDPDFASLQAVISGRVYGIPNAPFGWVERPPGPNRVIGIRWLAKTVYPDYANFDLDKEVREFFRLFYHIELSDEQLNEVYNRF